MTKEWFILIDGRQEGPYSFEELKRNPFITPDTLAWKKGYAKWQPIRAIEELKELFKDESEAVPTEERLKPKKPFSKLETEQDILALQRDPFQFFFWILILLLVLIYVVYQFYGTSP